MKCKCNGQGGTISPSQRFPDALKTKPIYHGREEKTRAQKRAELFKAVIVTNGTKSLQEIAGDVLPKHPLESCSQLLNGMRRWRWVNGEIYYGELPQIVVKPWVQKVEPYERREIPYEHETEIPFLTRQRHMILLDAPISTEESSSGHSTYGSNSLTPLEILMLKEEAESEEYQDRERRIKEWNRWIARRDSNSAFKNEIEKLTA